MATITSDNVHSLGTGIPCPVLTHQFRVRFEIGSVDFPILSCQTVNISYDLATGTGRMTVECARAGGVEQALQYLITAVKNPAVIIEMLDGHDGVDYGVEFNGWKMTKCQIDHDYAAIPVAVVIGDIEFSFESISCFKPDAVKKEA